MPKKPVEPALAEEPASLTLKEAVMRSVVTHPQAKGALDAWEAAEYNRKSAWGGYLPNLNVRAGYGPERTDDPSTRAAGEDERNLDRKEFGATLNQLIFDGFGVISLVNEREALKRAEGERVRDVKEVLAFRTTEAYLNVLEQREQVTLAQEHVKFREEKLRQITERQKSGVGLSSDVDQVNGRLFQSKTILLQRQTDLINAEANFLEVVGAPAKELTLPASISDRVPANLAYAQSKALANHPALKRRHAELESVQASIKGTEALFYPRFEIELALNRNDDIDGVEGRSDDERAVLVMSWNLFRGGTDFYNRLRLLSTEKENKEGIVALERVVRRNCTTAWSALEQARNDLANLEKTSVADKAVSEAFEAQFGLGKRTLLDLLNVEDAWFQSRTALITGRYDVLRGEYQVLSSISELLDALDLSQYKSK
ncbi:MAG: TolC family outer membrane protein [Desulfarculaceae bacterium]|jgi:adhesin transport system outer membrane protein